MRTLAILTALLAWVAHAQAQDTLLTNKQEMHRIQQDPKAYIARLENPTRDAYQKPDAVVKALQITPGEVIADIGAGSGYFTFRLAEAVGKSGRVYAVDVNADMVRHLTRRARDTRALNVVPVLCAPDDPLLGDASVDRFFICDTWHHIEGHPHYLALMKKMLKPGGQVVMVDFKKEKTPVGPPIEMRIARADLVQEMESNGFKLAAEHKILDHQYFLIFTVR